ncbi:hypothetical protein MLD38_023934 [Melastoma candidum]|nr:hypothetical protein MLD38_023934 [Melastoma candidum]
MEEFNWKDDEGSWDRLDGEEEQQGKCMNAFDIISLSSGIDLMSDNLDSGGGVSLTVERYMSAEPVEAILETVARAGEEEDSVEVVQWRKGWGVRLEGRDGEFVVSARVHRLTDELVVVEVRTGEVTDIIGRAGSHWDSGGGSSRRERTWKDKQKDMIRALAFRPEETESGEEWDKLDKDKVLCPTSTSTPNNVVVKSESKNDDDDRGRLRGKSNTSNVKGRS